MITSVTTLDQLLNEAKKSLKDVQSGELFIVKDLFRGFEWVRIARSNRNVLGSMFYAYSQGEGSIFVEAMGKTAQKQQIYKKI